MRNDHCFYWRVEAQKIEDKEVPGITKSSLSLSIYIYIYIHVYIYTHKDLIHTTYICIYITTYIYIHIYMHIYLEPK